MHATLIPLAQVAVQAAAHLQRSLPAAEGAVVVGNFQLPELPAAATAWCCCRRPPHHVGDAGVLDDDAAAAAAAAAPARHGS